MARVTVEDCIKKEKNRFNLVLLAAHRARRIMEGAKITVDREKDKDPIVALREIAGSSIDLKLLREDLVNNLQIVATDEESEYDRDKQDMEFGPSMDEVDLAQIYQLESDATREDR